MASSSKALAPYRRSSRASSRTSAPAATSTRMNHAAYKLARAIHDGKSARAAAGEALHVMRQRYGRYDLVTLGNRAQDYLAELELPKARSDRSSHGGVAAKVRRASEAVQIVARAGRRVSSSRLTIVIGRRSGASESREVTKASDDNHGLRNALFALLGIAVLGGLAYGGYLLYQQSQAPTPAPTP